VLQVKTIFRHCLTRVHAILSVLLGAFCCSLGITVLDFALRGVLGDWSGIAPIGRLYELPYRFAFAVGAALIVSFIALLFRYPPMTKRSEQFIFGALCGLVTIGSLFGPWISDTNVFFLICLLGAIGTSFWYRTALNPSGKARANK
jgi:hypothetical protein